MKMPLFWRRRQGMLQFYGGWKTDVGAVRSGNEDSVLPPTVLPIAGAGQALLAAIADGVGGMRDGSEASHAAIDALLVGFRPESASDFGSALLHAAGTCDAAVRKLNEGRAPDEEMASTLVAAALCGDRTWICHVGDSRAYLLQGRRLQRLTRDHSVVGDAVAAGEMSAAEARSSLVRNMITRSLGAGNGTPELSREVRLRRHDRLLLCSDGLHGPVPEALLELTLRRDEPAQSLAERCVQHALDRGAPDNVSAVVVRIEEGSELV